MIFGWLIPGRRGVPDAMSRAIQELRTMSGNLATEVQHLREAVTAITTVDASVVALIEGFDERVESAVQKALAAGATEDQLVAIREATAALVGEARTLAQAVVAGTPAAPTATTPPATPEPTEMPEEAQPAAGEVATSGTLTAG